MLVCANRTRTAYHVRAAQNRFCKISEKYWKKISTYCFVAVRKCCFVCCAINYSQVITIQDIHQKRIQSKEQQRALCRSRSSESPIGKWHRHQSQKTAPQNDGNEHQLNQKTAQMHLFTMNIFECNETVVRSGAKLFDYFIHNLRYYKRHVYKLLSWLPLISIAHIRKEGIESKSRRTERLWAFCPIEWGRSKRPR